MSDWVDCKLGSLLEIKYGKDHKKLGEGAIPCFGSGGLMRFVNDFLYDDESILIPRKGTLNNIIYKKQPFWTVDTMFWSKIDKTKVFPNFLFYQLTLIDYTTLNVGSAVQSLTVPVLKAINILLPPLPEQKAIASVLSSLDDKIDMLHRQNNTLEQLAETLFRQWFVEEADESWEYTTLDNYVECFNGVSYKSVDLNPSETAMVTLKNFARDGSFRLDGFKEFTGNYKEQHVVEEGTLVVAHTDITQDAALIGNPTLVINNGINKTFVISMDLVKVVPKYKWMGNEFLYYLMRTKLFKQHCLGYSNGSTVLHLSKTAIPSFEFFLPPQEQIELFTDTARELINKSLHNHNQIRTLEKLRDTLLPKLMSGEVRVEMD